MPRLIFSIVMLILLFLNSSCETQLENATENITNERSIKKDTIVIKENIPAKKIAIGITLQEKTLLRRYPNSESEIIKELDYGQIFYIYKNQESVENKISTYWCEIQLLEGNEKAWIRNNGIFSINPELVDNENNDFAGLYYQAGNWLATQYKKEDFAEIFLKDVLDNYSDKDIRLKVSYTDKIIIESGESLALRSLAKLYQRTKEYTKAIEYHEKFINLIDPTHKELLRSKMAIINTYHKGLKNKEKTLKLCHSIIRQHPDKQIFDMESNYWVDIQSATIIFDVIAKEDKQLIITECYKVINETSNKAIKILAFTEIIKAQISNGDFDSAESNIIKTLTNYPKEIRTYFKTDVNYGIVLLSASFERIKEITDDIKIAIELLERVKQKVNEKDIRVFADYTIAELLDYGNGGKEEVLSHYNALSEVYVYDGYQKKQRHPSLLLKRIEQINSFDSKKCIINKDIYLKKGIKSSIFSEVKKGTKAIILYKEKITEVHNNKIGRWTKIQLENKEVGWIHDSLLKEENVKPIFKPSNDNIEQTQWKMEGGNFNRTNYSSFKKISKPTIAMKIKDIVCNEVVFHDVNKDNVLDIIAYSSKGLQCINGLNQEIIWLFECSLGSIPLVNKNNIYIAAKQEGNEYAFSLDATNGQVIWQTKTGLGNYSGIPSSPVMNEHTIYFGTRNMSVLAMEKKTGIIEWEYELAYPIAACLTLANDMIYFLSREHYTCNNQLFAINSDSGAIEWKYKFLDSNRSGYLGGVSYQEGKIYSSGGNEFFYCINAQTGKIHWKSKNHDGGKVYNFAKPSLDKETIYYTDSTSGLCALNAQDGSFKWSHRHNHIFYGNPTVTKDAIYIRSIEGRVHALSTENGQPIWDIKIGNDAYGGIYNVSIAQGLLFIGSTDNTLYVIEENDLDSNNNSTN